MKYLETNVEFFRDKVAVRQQVANSYYDVLSVLEGLWVIDTTLMVDDSGWIAARCNSAHTNPVYIYFEGRPAGFAAPAKPAGLPSNDM